MASLAQQFTGLRCSPLSSSSRLSRRAAKNFPQNKSASVSPTIVAAVAMSSGQTKERLELKKMFEDAYERCRTAPMEGVAFTVDDFAAAIEQYDFNSEIGTRVCLISLLLEFEKVWESVFVIGLGTWEYA